MEIEGQIINETVNKNGMANKNGTAKRRNKNGTANKKWNGK